MDRYPLRQKFDIDLIQLLRVHAPKLLLVISVYFVYFFYRTGRTTFVFPVSGAVFGSLLAWAVIKRQHPSFDMPFSIQPGTVVSTLTRPRLSVTVILLYVSAVLILATNSLYAHPAVMYPLHGLAFAYLALNVYYNGSKVYNLLQIFLVAVATYWSAQLIFPSGSVSNLSHMRWGERIFEVGFVPEAYTYSYHPGFAIHSAALAEITTITPWKAFVFLAVVIVAGSVFVIGSLDNAIPSLSSRAVQLAALLFVTATFTLNRGLQPHTTSFFYVHTAVLFLVIFSVLGRRQIHRYVIVGLVVMTAAIFGHTFSAGAPVMILLFGIPLLVIYHLLPIEDKDRYAIGSMALFLVSYAVLFFTHQLYYEGGGHIYGRGASFIISMRELFLDPETDSTSTGTSGGVYGELPTDVLLQATFGDLLWFTLLFAGVCVLIARTRYDLDLVALLVAGGFMFLAASVVIHGADIPAQRVYQVIIVFGGCVAAGVGLLAITNSTPVRVRPVVLCSFVVLFAAFSLFSPVASLALTPLEVPHSQGHYSTAFDDAGAEWTAEFADGQGARDTAYTSVNDTVAVVDHESLSEGDLYVYDTIYADSGVQLAPASDFGGGEIAFAQKSPDMMSDNRVYTNSGSQAYRVRG